MPLKKSTTEKFYSPEQVSEFGWLPFSERQIRRICTLGKIGCIDVGTRSRHWFKLTRSNCDEYMGKIRGPQRLPKKK